MITKILDVQLPFFRPLWRRIALVAFTVGWAIFEWSIGNQLWAIGFGAIAAYCAHQFFIAFNPREPEDNS